MQHCSQNVNLLGSSLWAALGIYYYLLMLHKTLMNAWLVFLASVYVQIALKNVKIIENVNLLIKLLPKKKTGFTFPLYLLPLIRIPMLRLHLHIPTTNALQLLAHKNLPSIRLRDVKANSGLSVLYTQLNDRYTVQYWISLNVKVQEALIRLNPKVISKRFSQLIKKQLNKSGLPRKINRHAKIFISIMW